jgi:hypothetical protein
VIGIFVSIKAMLIAMIVVSILSLYVNCWGENKLLGYSFWEEMRDFLPVFGIALIIALIILCVQFLPVNCYIQLAIQADWRMRIVPFCVYLDQAATIY